MKRSLGSFDVLCLGLNAIVGSGIFLLPDELFREMGALSPLAFVLCALGLWPVAACYASAARNHDETGGPYLYAREAFGPGVAFVVGFLAFATGVLSFAAVSAAAASSLGRLVPALATPLGLLGTGAFGVLFFSGLNYLGARPGALTIDLFTVAKFAVLGVLLVTLLPAWGSAPAAPLLPRGGGGIGQAIFLAVFAAQGFEVVGVPAGESRNPQRDVPFAVVGSLLLASALYALVQLCLVYAYGELGRPSDTPLADAALSRNAALGLFVAIGGLVSTWGFVSGTALGTPRYLFALSRGGHLPAGLSALHARFQSPSVAIAVTALLALGLVAAFDYRSLVGMSNVTIAVQYASTCLAVGRAQRQPGGRKLAGGLTLPLLGTAMSLWILSEASLEELGWVAVTLGLGGIVVWLTGRKRSRRAGSKSPSNG
ncbi:MAG TPA: APC family permease [Polyangiaceae bacterium]|nr:APC family permease [Polyangiaceae bacterium]